MKGVKLNMQLVAISSGPKERRMIFLCPFNVNKANKILQATKNSTANMIVAMHKDLVKTIKKRFDLQKMCMETNEREKMAMDWMFFQV